MYKFERIPLYILNEIETSHDFFKYQFHTLQPGTYKVRNEIETKRNENETKRNQQKRNEINEIKRNERKQNEFNENKTK